MLWLSAAIWRVTIPTATSTSWPASSIRHDRGGRGDESDDVNYEPLRENFEQLSPCVTRTATRSPSSARLPQPKFVEGSDCPPATRTSTSPTAVVIVPQFDDPADDQALGTLQDLFPDREIAACRRRSRVGARRFHCLSQQEPH